jgi:large subunit ribosomal protein L15
MKLVDLHPAEGARRNRKRVGRGIGSGHGKTSCRGHKGDKSRGRTKVGFEGGQTPLYRRLPQTRGFKNRFKKLYAVVNIGRLERFDAGTVVTPELLLETEMISDVLAGVRILGDGELTKSLTIRAHHFSKGAEDKIKAAGGAPEVL